MKTVLACALFCLSISSTLCYEIVQDEEGRAYYMVPLQRQRRATTTWEIQGPPGLKPTVKHEGTIYKDDNNNLYGSIFAQKNFAPKEAGVVGGSVMYKHEPSQVSFGLQGKHTQHGGDDLAAKAQWDIFKHKQGGIDLSGTYGRHYGGPQRTGKPEAGVFLNSHFDF